MSCLGSPTAKLQATSTTRLSNLDSQLWSASPVPTKERTRMVGLVCKSSQLNSRYPWCCALTAKGPSYSYRGASMTPRIQNSSLAEKISEIRFLQVLLLLHPKVPSELERLKRSLRCDTGNCSETQNRSSTKSRAGLEKRLKGLQFMGDKLSVPEKTKAWV